MPCLCGGSSKVAPVEDAHVHHRTLADFPEAAGPPERQDRTLDTKPVALEEFERIEGRSAAKADQHRERAKSIMVKSRASEPSPQSPPLDDDAELSDADSF